MHTSGALRREIESAYPFGCLKMHHARAERVV
jgi:hypothetical protein